MFPQADFFTEFERFDRHCEKLKRSGNPIDFVVVCSPNYLHDAHCRFGLRIGADVICEKPVVLNPWNAEALMEMEKETGRKIYTVLQLRHHPAMLALKERIAKAAPDKKYQVALKYITPRGRWYYHSWKGNMDKSGGIATNIGIHFFDLLLWIFGAVKKNEVGQCTSSKASGRLELERADVNWMLSTDEGQLPEEIKRADKPTYRSLVIDGKEVEFSDGFSELHTKSYEEILSGKGIVVEEVQKLIRLLHDIRIGCGG